jgi:hypothetical protein
MNSLEVADINNFEFVKVFINNNLVKEEYATNNIIVNFDDALPVDIDVEFKPHKIKPIVRYNNIMVDYWLANILLQDHKIQFTISDNFFQEYRNKDIQGRIDSLPEEQKNVEHFYDKYIGVDNLHPEIVNEIKKLID